MKSAKKLLAMSLVGLGVLTVSSNALAAYAATDSFTPRQIVNVRADYVTVRSSPSPSASAITTQAKGLDLVETVAGSSPVSAGGYVYKKFDYVLSGSGGYSDTRSGWVAISGPDGQYLFNATGMSNTTTQNTYTYSNLTGVKGTLPAGSRTSNGGLQGAPDNPNAWRYSFDLTGTGFINGWNFDAY